MTKYLCKLYVRNNSFGKDSASEYTAVRIGISQSVHVSEDMKSLTEIHCFFKILLLTLCGTTYVNRGVKIFYQSVLNSNLIKFLFGLKC